MNRNAGDQTRTTGRNQGVPNVPNGGRNGANDNQRGERQRVQNVPNDGGRQRVQNVPNGARRQDAQNIRRIGGAGGGVAGAAADADVVFDVDAQTPAAGFSLDIRRSKSFKGANWAEEKTYHVVPRQQQQQPQQQQPQQPVLLDNILRDVSVMFDNLVDDVRARHEPQSIARVYIDHPTLNKAIIVPPQPLDYLTSREIMEQVEFVLSSAEGVPVDGELDINVAVVRPLGGRGHRDNMFIHDYTVMRKKKRSILTVDSPTADDKFCLPRAIVLAHAYANAYHHPDVSARNHKISQAKTLAHKHSANKLTRKVLDLMAACNIPTDRAGLLEDIPKYEEHLQISVCVMSSIVGKYKAIYQGHEDFRERHQRLYLYHSTEMDCQHVAMNGSEPDIQPLSRKDGPEYGHFDVIRNMAAFMLKAHYCYDCDKPYNSAKSHSCTSHCTICQRKTCQLNTSVPQKHCPDCNRTCRSLDCYKIHKRQKRDKDGNLKDPLCTSRFKCEHCSVTLETHRRPKHLHICGEYFCRNCHRWFDQDQEAHLCHMRSVSATSFKTDKLVFYDFETTQQDDIHIPNLVVAQTVCSKCKHLAGAKYCFDCGSRCSKCEVWNSHEQTFERNPCNNQVCGLRERYFRSNDVTQEFGRWLISPAHRGATVIAHNAKGFDNYFIYRYCISQNIAPTLITNGTKIVYMHISNMLNIRFIDSCSFLPMSLAELPECFDLLEMKKGYFPHFFNREENFYTVQEGLPPMKAYGYDTMAGIRRDNFLEWYDKNKQKTFDFEIELLDYCKSDVDILQRACLSYQDLMIKSTEALNQAASSLSSDSSITPICGVDPLGLVSAASVCMAVFRSKFLPETWEVLLKKNANTDCYHDIHCSCTWTEARKTDGDSLLEVWLENEWKPINTFEFGAIITERFVRSSIALIPPTEYSSRDNHSFEAMQWLTFFGKQYQERNNIHIDIQHAHSIGGEKIVMIPSDGIHPPSRYKLDGYFFDPIHRRDVALEFYGCHWHGCPECYNGSARRDIICVGKSMQQRYDETMLREKRLSQRGYHVISIWACEFAKMLRQVQRKRTQNDHNDDDDDDDDNDDDNDDESNNTPTTMRLDKISQQVLNEMRFSKDRSPLNLRDAYFGGRCNALKLFHVFESPSKGKLVDFTSLYPWVLKYGRYPVSHPVRVTTLKPPIWTPCTKTTSSTSDGMCSDDPTRFCPSFPHKHASLEVFGIIKLKILPPTNLLHPVLPYRSNGTGNSTCSRAGKLLFPLCRTCGEENQQTGLCQHSDEERAWVHTYCTPEVEVALDMGYKILEVFDVLHWSESAKMDVHSRKGGVFAKYVDTFLRIKQQASGLPTEFKENPSEYVKQYFKEEGIEMDVNKIHKSSALRSLAKLLLNSFYGKFAQRVNLRQTHLINTVEGLHNVMVNPSKVVLDFHVIDEDMMQVETENHPHFAITDLKTNVVIAAFTTCWARLKLWVIMQQLGPRVMYTDTDSILYESSPGLWEPPTGNLLGDLVDEHSCKKLGCSGCETGHYITEFVSGGSKNYAYKLCTGEHMCKIRGFTLNYSASRILNFNSLKECVLTWYKKHRLEQQKQQEQHQMMTEEEMDDFIGEFLKEQEDNRQQPEQEDIVISSMQIARDKKNATVYNRKITKTYGLVYDKNQVTFNYCTQPFGFIPPTTATSGGNEEKQEEASDLYDISSLPSPHLSPFQDEL